MEKMPSLEDMFNQQYQLTETIVLEDNHYDHEDFDDDQNYITQPSSEQTNQLDVISEQQQHSEMSPEQDLSSQQEQSFQSNESSQSSSTESQNQSEILKNELFDELILEIDQFQKLYYLSSKYNGQNQKLHTKKSCQNITNQIINSQKNSKKRTFSIKNSMEKSKKTPQIYHPDIWQIKRFYFELKRLHLFSLLKNAFFLQNYEPLKCRKSTFFEQVDLLLESHRVKFSDEFQSNKQKGLEKTDNSVRKIYIKRCQDKPSSMKLENYFNLTREQSESEEEYQLIEVQKISFNFKEKNPFKNKYNSSLSTTIDFDPIQQQNKQ